MARVDVDLRLNNRQFNRGIRESQSRISTAQIAVGSFIASLATEAVSAFGRAVVSSFASIGRSTLAIERTTAQFTALTGSADIAAVALEQVSTFAARTPFDNPTVERAATQLLAFGVSVGDVGARLETLGNIAGVSNRSIAEIGTIFGQVRAQGRLTGERFNQLVEGGINLGGALAQRLGVPLTQVRDEIMRGNVSFEVFRGAIEELGESLNGIEVLSMTLGGAISTLDSQFELARRNLGTQFVPVLRDIVNTLGQVIGENQDLIRELGGDLAQVFGRAVLSIIDGVDILARNFNSLARNTRGTFNGVTIIIRGFSQAFIDGLRVIVTGFNLFVGELATRIGALNERFDRFVPDGLVNGLNAATMAGIGFSDSLDEISEGLRADIQQDIQDIGDSYRNLIPADAVEGFRMRLQQLRDRVDEHNTALEIGAEGLRGRVIGDTTAAANQGSAASGGPTLGGPLGDEPVVGGGSANAAFANQMLMESQQQRLEIVASGLQEEDALRLQNDVDKLQQQEDFVAAQARIDESAAADTRRRMMDQFFEFRSIQQAQADFQRLTENQKVMTVQTGLGAISQLTRTETGALFEVGKAAAKAEAVINAYRAANAAYASLAGIPVVGPALGVAAAGAAIISGIRNVEQINRQQPGFQTGGSITGSSYSGDNVLIRANSGESVLTRNQQGEINERLDQSGVETRLDRLEIALMQPIVVTNANGQMFAEFTREGVRDGIDLSA